MCYVFAFGQETNYVNMVANAADTYDMAACGINQLADIAMHPLQMLVGYLWACSLHVEDNVQVYFAKRLWHAYKAFAPSGRLYSLIIPLPRVLPWAMGLLAFQAVSSQVNLATHQFRKQAVASFGEEADLRGKTLHSLQ